MKIKLINKTKEDYIELNSFNTNLEINDIKKELEDKNIYWREFVNILKEDIKRSKYNFVKLNNWIKNFENFLEVQNFFPNIENTATLMSMKNFNSYSINPIYNNNDIDFEEYKEILITQNDQKYIINKTIKEINIEPKSVDNKEFKIIRIQNQEENNNKKFLDIKVRFFNRKNFLYNVLSLPEFWRDFHFVSRKHKNNFSILNPTYEINKKLNYFYTPNKDFNISSINGKNKKEIFDNIKAESPLNIDVNTFAMHLFLSMPGLALPLTKREQEWSSKQKPEMTISIAENEVSLIIINFSKNVNENRMLLKSFSEDFSEREKKFSNFFDLGQYSGGKYILTNTEEFAFVLESNMIELFDSLTKFDEQSKI